MRVISIIVVLFCFLKTSECFPRVTEFEMGGPDETDDNTNVATGDENTLDESLNDDFEDREDALDQSNVAKPKSSDDFVFEDDKTDRFTVDPEVGDDLDDFTVDPEIGDDLHDFTLDPEEGDDLHDFTVDPEVVDDLDDFTVDPGKGDNLHDFTVDPEEVDDLHDFTAESEVGDDLDDFEDRCDSSTDDEVQLDGERDLHHADDNRHDDAINFVSPEQGSARAGPMKKFLHVSEPSSDVMDTPIGSGQDIQVTYDVTGEPRQVPSSVAIDETQQSFDNIEDSSDDSAGLLQPFDITDKTQQDDLTSEEHDMLSSEATLPAEDSRQFSFESEEMPQDDDDMQAAQDSEMILTPLEPSNGIDKSDDFDDNEESFDY